MPVSLLPQQQPRWWPTFTSTLRSTAVTARVGRVLGICFAVCFVTGMLSHYQYGPWTWLPEPSAPAYGYRVTQGLHVVTGIVSIPLLLIKLWSVYPRLFSWPPARTAVEALERLSIAVLVSTALVELVTGFMNAMDWYAFRWPFVSVHRFLAYVVIGSLLLHVAVKLPVIRSALRAPLSEGERGGGLSRRGLLIATGAGAGLVAATTAGQTVTVLQDIGLLALRRRKDATEQRLPVNRTAAEARIVVPADWSLRVLGPRAFTLTLADVEALAEHEATLPIACVEGWSADARWRGLRLVDLVERAGGTGDSRVGLNSMETSGAYGRSVIEGPQLSRALLATHLDGERLDLDHGYPLRLIAPNRAGVLQTKWVDEVVVL